MAFGPAAGLEHVDALTAEPSPRQSNHLLPSVRGDLLSKRGRLEEARAESSAKAHNESLQERSGMSLDHVPDAKHTATTHSLWQPERIRM
jgi:predicted RNA polymerase sigma factor